jgi:hypothetical protein
MDFKGPLFAQPSVIWQNLAIEFLLTDQDHALSERAINHLKEFV